MKNVIENLEAKIVSAEKDIEQAKKWIKDIDGGYTGHGSRDHYERSVLMSESYIVGLKISISEIKQALA